MLRAHRDRFFCWLILALVSCAASAAPYEKGLLWKIERDGVAPSYVFGTMHSEDERVLALPGEVQAAFDHSASYTMEVVVSPEAAQEMAFTMLLTDGRDLKGVLGPALYAKVVPLMIERGMPEEALQRLKPWAVFVTLSMPPPKTGIFLDTLLQNQAMEQEKKVHGLETIAEQLGVFDRMPMEDQIAMVIDTVQHYDELQKGIDELLGLYLARDLKGMQAINAKHMAGGDTKLAARLTEALIDTRNRRMAERMRERLQEGNAFIAVGALHLPGETGVLNLLTKRGYRVTAVY